MIGRTVRTVAIRNGKLPLRRASPAVSARHPNDAGYAAGANAINLRLFQLQNNDH